MTMVMGADQDTRFWTTDRVEKMKSMWQDGKSAAQIAMAVGHHSRSAILGKIHRMGLSTRFKFPRSTPGTAQPKKQLPPRPVFKYKAHPLPEKKIMEFAPKIAPAAVTVEAEIALPLSARVTLEELHAGMCHWPFGDPRSPDFRYCGASSSVEQSYCAYHQKIAYQPPSDRRRENARAKRAMSRAI